MWIYSIYNSVFCNFYSWSVSGDRKRWRLWLRVNITLPLNLNPTHTLNANNNHYSHKYKSPDRFAKHQVCTQWVHWSYLSILMLVHLIQCLISMVSLSFTLPVYFLYRVLCMCSSLWFWNIICMNPCFGDYQTSLDFPCAFFLEDVFLWGHVE